MLKIRLALHTPRRIQVGPRVSRMPESQNHAPRGPSNWPFLRPAKTIPTLEHRHSHSSNVQWVQTPPNGSRPTHPLATSYPNERHLGNIGHRCLHPRLNRFFRHPRSDHNRQRKPVLIGDLATTPQGVGHKSPLHHSLPSAIEWPRRKIPQTSQGVIKCSCSRRTRKLVLGPSLYTSRDSDDT